MAYYDISLLAVDQDFFTRTTAAYATETLGTSPASGVLPPQWAGAHMWDMAAQPGFGDAYASALASEIPNPGRDPSVISDAQILSAVQVLITASG